MKYLAHINVMPLKELLDPQGKTVGKNMANIGITGIEDVRIGKHIHIVLEADDDTKAKNAVDEACKKILSNPIMESYTFTITPL